MQLAELVAPHAVNGASFLLWGPFNSKYQPEKDVVNYYLTAIFEFRENCAR